jgi:hypothetical protein
LILARQEGRKAEGQEFTVGRLEGRNSRSEGGKVEGGKVEGGKVGRLNARRLESTG